MMFKTPFNEKKMWLYWGLAISLITAMFVFQMDIAPYLDEDEFMIIDLGRTILNPDSGWSITWMANRNEPAFIYFYIGPVLNEIAYQYLGEFGPRIVGLVGALIASTIMLIWLRSRGTTLWGAFLLSLIFLLNPVFVQSYTLGRVDGWAIAFCLLSCWILRIAWNNPYRTQLILLAGFCTSIAVYIWPSAVFLIPLILGELLVLNLKDSGREGKSGSIFKSVGTYAIAGVMGALILMVPIAPQIVHYFSNFFDSLIVNMFRDVSSGEQGSISYRINTFLEIFRGLKFTPVLVLFAILAAILKKDYILIFGILATVLMLNLTLVYIHRVQYILPYLIALVAGLFSTDIKKEKIGRLYNYLPSIRFYGGILMAIWVVGISVVARSYLAMENEHERDRNLVLQAAVNMIGPGNHNVYTSAPEFYLAGRSLGWKMFRRYAAMGDTRTSASIEPIITEMKYVILMEQEVSETIDKLLKDKGFSQSQWFTLYEKPIDKFDGIITNELRLRNLFSIYEHPYGPYKLYVKNDF